MNPTPPCRAPGPPGTRHGSTQETAALIEKTRQQAAAFTVDVSDRPGVQALAADVRARFGTVHVLVNNAVMYHSIRLDSQMDVDIDYWRKMFAVNVEGVLLCTQALAPMMIEQKYGRIINQAIGQQRPPARCRPGRAGRTRRVEPGARP